jgi:hypothetical protein
MKYTALVALFAALSFTQISKPVCSGKNQGRLWPEEANYNRQAARKFYLSGELEMCTMTPWRHRWKALSVNIHQLEAKRAHGSARVAARGKQAEERAVEAPD